MANKSPSNPKVSLFGVNKTALLLGRACALQDNPVLGVYDPDPQRALQAALFLGVSARPTPEAVLSDGPDIVLCSTSVPKAPPDTLLIQLGPKQGESVHPNHCWADTGESDQVIPDQISNDLPVLSFSLHGPEPTVGKAREFLQGLSANLRTS